MIKPLTEEYLEEVVQIHHSSWDTKEFSMKLGLEYIELFYKHVIKSKDAIGYVYLDENNQVVAYAVGMIDYFEFNKTFQDENFTKLAFILIKKLFVFKVTINDFFDLRKSSKICNDSKFSKHHLGALALHNRLKKTPEGKEAIKESIVAVLNYFKDNKYSGCWGLCDEINMPMRKFLERLAFTEINTYKLSTRALVLYDLPFHI